MTAARDADTRPRDSAGATVRLTSWPARASAIGLDVSPGAAVIATMGLLAYSTPPQSWLWWFFTGALAAAVLASLVNRWILPSITGWTMGKAVAGIRLTTWSGRPAGSVRLLARDVAHILDTGAFFVGRLWPLGDRKHRTFADVLMRTEVRVISSAELSHRNLRRLAIYVVAAVAVVSVAGTGLAYWLVYRQDRALMQARIEIAEQGPRIVEQLLTFGTKSVADGFAPAQTLATEGYRPLLIQQQQAVQRSGVTDNTYSAVSSAVLSATVDRSAMLLALQGQRGSDPDSLIFLTATVRADFEKSTAGWQVADLTVLKRPLIDHGSAPS